jgi:predicted thioredoxin/glutaredoxin
MNESGRVIIYTTRNCGACDHALRDLRADGVDFEERNVMASKQWWDEALRYGVSVPIILRDGKVEYGWKGEYGCEFF